MQKKVVAPVAPPPHPHETRTHCVCQGVCQLIHYSELLHNLLCA